MKKVTLILIVFLTFAFFSCGDSANSNSANKEKKTTEKTNQLKQKQKGDQVYKYAKDEYLKDIDFKAKENKFSTADWERISKTCNAFDAFKKTVKNRPLSKDNLETFFKNQGYKDYQEGKDDIYLFSGLYKIVVGFPNELGILKTIKKLYSKEEYEKACNSTADIYNENGLTAEDVKNIEKNKRIINKASLIKISIETAEALSNK